MIKQDLNDFKILNSIKKNVRLKKWSCLHSVCDCDSINSHFHQQKGVLNLLAEDNHLFELKKNDLFQAKEKGEYGFFRIGIRKAFSLPMFCACHDTDLFKDIENKDTVSFDDYNTQLLLSYRACCNEIRRKEIVNEVYRRILQSKLFQNKIIKDAIIFDIPQHNLGIRDYMFYKGCFESQLSLHQTNTFSFEVFDYPLIKLCASGVFTPLDNFDSIRLQTYLNQEKPLNTVFINIFPYKNRLFLIFGYHNSFTSTWIKDYIRSWKDIDCKMLGIKLTDLFTTKMNSWILSPELFQKIPQCKKDIFINYWNNHADDLSIHQRIDFDLFENILTS